MEHLIINFTCFLLGIGISALFSLVLINKIKNVVNNDFAKIANITIKNEQEDLRKQNREALEEKLQPLTKQLDEFKNSIIKFNITGVENTTRIIEQLGVLEKNNKSIEQEARNLTDALTKNQNIKGTFGEDIIDTVLQYSGMVEGVHYVKQYSSLSENLKDDTIHKVRPDFVINLPDNRHLIIDSKVTLTSYLEYIKDSSKLKDFKYEVKKRINDLALKNYNNVCGINQPDFILMYMPIEGSVGVLYEDAEIVDLAYKSNIIIVSTASLLAAIRLVGQLYTQQKQSENLQKIIDAGTNLYETFVLLCEELNDIQRGFDGLSQQFTTTINRFKRANKNKPSLFSQVNELKNLGISSGKSIPDNFLDSVNDENEALVND